MPKYKGKEYSYTKTGVNKFLEEKQKDLEEDYKVVDDDRKQLKEKFHLKTGIDPDEFYKVKEFYMKNIGNFPED